MTSLSKAAGKKNRFLVCLVFSVCCIALNFALRNLAALIGIPPASGFISKWYLATGALDSGLGIFSWLGPVVLLTSALLTAGYLLPITVNGFLPGADFEYEKLQKKEPNLTMLVPLLILAALAVLLGVVLSLIFLGKLIIRRRAVS